MKANTTDYLDQASTYTYTYTYTYTPGAMDGLLSEVVGTLADRVVARVSATP